MFDCILRLFEFHSQVNLTFFFNFLISEILNFIIIKKIQKFLITKKWLIRINQEIDYYKASESFLELSAKFNNRTPKN